MHTWGKMYFHNHWPCHGAGQCGGDGGFSKGALRRDVQYANSCCEPIRGQRAVCQRRSSAYWQCVVSEKGTV